MSDEKGNYSKRQEKVAPGRSGIREIFACGDRNPGLWNSENSRRNPGSHFETSAGNRLLTSVRTKAWETEKKSEPTLIFVCCIANSWSDNRIFSNLLLCFCFFFVAWTTTSISGKFGEDASRYRAQFQASSVNSESVNWPWYEAGPFRV